MKSTRLDSKTLLLVDHIPTEDGKLKEVDPGSYFPTHNPDLDDDGVNQNQTPLNNDPSHFDQDGNRIVRSTDHKIYNLPTGTETFTPGSSLSTQKKRDSIVGMVGYTGLGQENPWSDKEAQDLLFPKIIDGEEFAHGDLRFGRANRPDAAARGPKPRKRHG